MPVVTPERAAQYLNVDLETAGPAFRMLCEAANRAVEDHCRRRFDLQTHTEYHDIVGAVGTLFVRNPPIVTLTSVTDDANTSIITTRSNRSISITADVELYPDTDPDRIRLVNNEATFATGPKAAKVVYTGGYHEQDMPADLVLAGCWIVAAWWEGPEALSRAAQNVGGESITWRAGALPPQAEALLNRYRRVVV